jgi:spore maturation protein A
MLNYIWAGLIILSLGFALLRDVDDILFDRYRNGKSLQVQIDGRGSDVKVRIDPAKYKGFYGVEERIAETIPATLVLTSRGKELRFPASATLPPTLARIRDATSGDDPKWLLAAVTQMDETTGESAIRFEPVRWVTVANVGDAAISMAKTAVELSLKLIGTLALFLGVMQIAEKAGIIDLIVVVTGPLLRPLFPGIPKGHPAMGLVTLNLTANMLGLGNAATPFGIKAMEELQKLNKKTDTASNAMVMLLAMNTAGVQLLPPMMLYAVMGLRASELYFPILIVTGICLMIAIASAKLLERLPAYRASDPDRLPELAEAA